MSQQFTSRDLKPVAFLVTTKDTCWNSGLILKKRILVNLCNLDYFSMFLELLFSAITCQCKGSLCKAITDSFNPLIAYPTKWSNTLKQFVSKLPTNCLSVFDHFVILALKGLTFSKISIY